MDYSKLTAEEQSQIAADNFMKAAKNLQEQNEKLAVEIKKANEGFDTILNDSRNKHKAETIQAVNSVNKILSELKKGGDLNKALAKLNALKPK